MDRFANANKDGASLFSSFKRELARLHEPVSAQGSMQLIPVNVKSIKLKGPDLSRAGSKAESSEGKQEKKRQPERVGDPNAQGESTSPIVSQPASIEHRLAFFGNEQFEFTAPYAEMVQLVCESTRAERQVVMMERHDGGSFRTTIGLPDGDYLFGYRVHGCTRPDPKRTQRLVMCNTGLFTELRLTRQQTTLILINQSQKPERVLLEASAPWLVLNRPRLDIPVGGSVEISVHFDPGVMIPGSNEGELSLSIEHEGEAVFVGVIHVVVIAEVDGAVLDVRLSPRQFGEIQQGIDNVHLKIEVTARGRGPLTGIITLAQSSELVDFQLDADDTSSQFVHTFHIKSAFLPKPRPHKSEAELVLKILTDSFLANRRLYRAEIPYHLIYLRKSLPALSFGDVRQDSTKSLRLDVVRSDNREIELVVELPPMAVNYLEAYQARANAYVFRFNAALLKAGASVNEVVHLVDRKSGLRDQIKVLATVAGVKLKEPVAVSVVSS